MTIRIQVNDRTIEGRKAQSLLQTCLENDIYIPNLCYIPGMDHPPASCRLCFVEVDGFENPVTSCTLEIFDGMVVKTDTPAVRRLQKTAFQFLLSVHEVDCKNCPANRKCDLQRLARYLQCGLKTKGLQHYTKEMSIDGSHPQIAYYPNRCVLCGKCIYICKKENKQPLFSFSKRGFDTVISVYNSGNGKGLNCGFCMACIEICPVAALVEVPQHTGEPCATGDRATGQP
jgi:bidirectional [NiFe] hydrogenase diaphorase subunit